MKLFFHHVGQIGSAEDFPKTIYGSRLISEVESSISDVNPEKYPLIQSLMGNFPSGRFNCWGVPEGAKSVIRNLSKGDCVLLVQSARIDGMVPILCKVKVFHPVKLNELSKQLWGDDKYPFIFFFDTLEISLTWIEFREHMGYMERFDPRGNIYKVDENRLSSYGSVPKYIEFIENKYSIICKSKLYEDIYVEKKLLKETNSEYKNEINAEVDRLFEKRMKSPELEHPTDKNKYVISITPRDEAFRRTIKKIYKNTCAICGSSILSPDGHPEVQSAHIYPKSLNGADDIRNGICLCRFHHWAFDCGWISIANDYTILVKNEILNKVGYENIVKYVGKKIITPADKSLAPHSIYLTAHRKNYGFKE